ncbi:hypothetical protein AXG93_3789s1060 [Marchantia polymorpha subsp. ruderalis]|uniref:Uncharacterized protein n=1 Tax=Marchantia polymorpha subsp. ruderalis TaxID=1480154 RepID=A0A176WGU3_MARPO|nr:hypothetical protein AXG93_3789s1060 [Marchantia polymorpha subsp. ruderalis]
MECKRVELMRRASDEARESQQVTLNGSSNEKQVMRVSVEETGNDNEVPVKQEKMINRVDHTAAMCCHLRIEAFRWVTGMETKRPFFGYKAEDSEHPNLLVTSEINLMSKLAVRRTQQLEPELSPCLLH